MGSRAGWNTAGQWGSVWVGEGQGVQDEALLRVFWFCRCDQAIFFAMRLSFPTCAVFPVNYVALGNCPVWDIQCPPEE